MRSVPVIVVLSCSLASGCDWLRSSPPVASATPTAGPARLLIAVVAEDGDEYAGRRFDLEAFEARRKAASEVGETWEPAGFRRMPVRPQRERGESESDFRPRVDAFEVTLASDPDAVETVWLACDRFFFDHETAFGFTERDFESARAGEDEMGRHLSLTVRSERRDAFADFTEKYRGRRLAMVFDGRVILVAVLHEGISKRLQVHAWGGVLESDFPGITALIEG